MMAKEKVVFCWSGGKDSALALNRILNDAGYDVLALLSMCNEHFERVSMHGVRVALLDRQAQAIGLPLEKIFLSCQSSNDEYHQKMSDCLLAYKAKGITGCVFGDIFLEDLRRWREENLALVGLRGIFPLWKIASNELIQDFITLQFGSIVCCTNDAYLDEAFVGRNIDADFIASLPSDVDPCGENGEFHSFAFAGPIFKEPVEFEVGNKVYRPIEETHPGATSTVCPSPSARRTRGFWFCDLIPA
jgi:uncharacterized protein (TIGR00290 family)